jgi:single-stranded-DNA-specific exonuclease
MPLVEKRWQVAPRLTPEADQALEAFPPVFRQLLYNRACFTYEQAYDYLSARPPANCESSALSGLPSAVERLKWAIQWHEPVAVYGDYDVDGVTATALLVLCLQALGAQVRGYIPNRFDEGYGLNNEALAALAGSGVRLVVTVDCGIRSVKEAEYAAALGLDLIISDHHHPGNLLPPALALINPKQPGDPYPDKHLAGVGLAYKLASALAAALPEPAFRPEDLLDLVALGTVSDLAPLVGENRTLVRAGLKAIRQPRRQGVYSLIEVAGLKADRISATNIGFVLGPRLNAAGRLESAQDAYQLLVTEDIMEAGRLAQKLDVQNRERQQLTRHIQAQAEQIALADRQEAMLLFAAHPDFNPGVVGLAASRLSEQYYRPAIVAQAGETYTRGSCRSIPEFHITQALDQCADLLERHGGHAAAAGFTVRTDRLPELMERLHAIAWQELADKVEDLRPLLRADCEVQLSELRPELLNLLEYLEPVGYGNPPAVFISRDLPVKYSRPVGHDGAHLKLTVSDGRVTFDAIAFRQGHWAGRLPERVDLAYTFERNDYNGQSFLQLNVIDIKPAGAPAITR